MQGAEGTIARVPMRRDGWASIRSVSTAWSRPGTLKTKPFTYEGSQLLLNALVSNGGSIRVALLPVLEDDTVEAQEGRTLDGCVPVGGNVFAAAVEWHTSGRDVAELAGHLVQLEFELRSAQLFSFRFE